MSAGYCKDFQSNCDDQGIQSQERCDELEFVVHEFMLAGLITSPWIQFFRQSKDQSVCND